MGTKCILRINILIILSLFSIHVVYSQELQSGQSNDTTAITLVLELKDVKVSTTKQKVWSGIKLDDKTFPPKLAYVFSSMGPKKGQCFGLVSLAVYNKKISQEDSLIYKDIIITGKEGSAIQFYTLLDFKDAAEKPVKAYSASAVSQKLKPQSVDTLNILFSIPNKSQTLLLKYKENPLINIPVNIKAKAK